MMIAEDFDELSSEAANKSEKVEKSEAVDDLNRLRSKLTNQNLNKSVKKYFNSGEIAEMKKDTLGELIDVLADKIAGEDGN